MSQTPGSDVTERSSPSFRTTVISFGQMSRRRVVRQPNHPGPVARGEAFYRPGLDVLRFVAFLLVFVAHALVLDMNSAGVTGSIARAGEFGVCVFFFLSAYLITELLLREKAVMGTIDIRSFYIRRILRIWPLYLSLIFLGWLRGVLSPEHTLSGPWLAAMLFLASNIYGTRHGYPPGFLLPLWSIAIEEQFYLFWPWLVRRFATVWIGLVSIGLIVVANLRMSSIVSHRMPVDPALWEDSFVQFQFFALGTLLAIVLRGRIPALPRAACALLFGASMLSFLWAQVAIADARLVGHPGYAFVGAHFAVALLGCLALFFSLIGGTAHFLKPFIYLGRISYGLYMFHFAILSTTRSLIERVLRHPIDSVFQRMGFMLVALVGTIACGMLSYRFFETPFLRLKKRYAVIASRPI